MFPDNFYTNQSISKTMFVALLHNLVFFLYLNLLHLVIFIHIFNKLHVFPICRFNSIMKHPTLSSLTLMLPPSLLVASLLLFLIFTTTYFQHILKSQIQSSTKKKIQQLEKPSFLKTPEAI